MPEPLRNNLPLMPHQAEAVSLIIEKKRILLAHEPGCGKTLTTLAALKEANARRVLIVAPSPLLSVWRDEANKWLGCSVPVDIVRLPPAKRQAFWKELTSTRDETMRLVVVSYETMRADYPLIKPVFFDALVYDETLKIQTPTSKVSKRALGLHAPCKIALNGTPLSNSWADLWAVCTWLDPQSLYGNFYRFRAIHAVMNPNYPAIVGWRGEDEIKKRTAHVIHNVRKVDVLQDLPPLTEQTINVELSSKERAVYARLVKELKIELQGEDVPVLNALTKLLRLRQTANGLFAFGEDETSAKIEAIKEIVSSLGDGKVIIFSSFAQTADAVAKAVPGALKITGETKAAERDEIVQRFTASANVLVGTDAIAYGLNLQAASFIINVDLPWSFAKYEQRIGRAWRKGQTKPVTVYNLIASKTVDEHVQKILSNKTQMADDLRGVTAREILDIIDT